MDYICLLGQLVTYKELLKYKYFCEQKQVLSLNGASKVVDTHNSKMKISFQ